MSEFSRLGCVFKGCIYIRATLFPVHIPCDLLILLKYHKWPEDCDDLVRPSGLLKDAWLYLTHCSETVAARHSELKSLRENQSPHWPQLDSNNDLHCRNLLLYDKI